VDADFIVMSTEEMQKAPAHEGASIIILRDRGEITGYVENGQLVTCDDAGGTVSRLETVSGNATLLEAVTTLLESGRTRAVVQDPDGTVLGTISVPIVAGILAKVAR
jgi:CBS domain-containing protein